MFFLFILSFIIGCSQISLFTLLSNEQEGEFSLNDEMVNIKEGEVYQTSASGGFLPYSYAILSGEGSINPDSGKYTAPSGISGFTEVEIESTDGIGAKDSAMLRVYELFSVNPASFSIRVGGANEPLTVSGGVGDYAISTETGKIFDTGGITEIDIGTGPSFDFEYQAPAVKGMDFITITDEIENSLSISVEVLPPEGSELELFPSYVILEPSPPGQAEFTFEVLGGIVGPVPSDWFSFELAAGSAGSLLPAVYNSGESKWEAAYQVPGIEGSGVLTVTNANPVTLEVYGQVSSDIYILADDPPLLEIKPSFRLTFSGRKVTFTASGGIPPYDFAIIEGGGTLDQISADEAVLETARPSPIVIRLMDAIGSSAQANVLLLF